jgi:hypothetical protein
MGLAAFALEHAAASKRANRRSNASMPIRARKKHQDKL